jgi:hypothetical protein
MALATWVVIWYRPSQFWEDRDEIFGPSFLHRIPLNVERIDFRLHLIEERPWLVVIDQGERPLTIEAFEGLHDEAMSLLRGNITKIDRFFCHTNHFGRVGLDIAPNMFLWVSSSSASLAKSDRPMWSNWTGSPPRTSEDSEN